MKEIILAKGEIALVDDEDFDRLVAMGKWRTLKGYAILIKHVTTLDGRRTTSGIRMHRVIMNTPKGMCTDHIDGNPLNNQKSNLRICTVLENARNKGKMRDNTSGYKGVCWHKRDQKWTAQIKAGAGILHLGYFTDKIEAAKAYNVAATLLHGEFARLNPV